MVRRPGAVVFDQRPFTYRPGRWRVVVALAPLVWGPVAAVSLLRGPWRWLVVPWVVLGAAAVMKDSAGITVDAEGWRRHFPGLPVRRWSATERSS